MSGTVADARKRKMKVREDDTVMLLRWYLCAVIHRCGGTMAVTVADLAATRKRRVLVEQTDHGVVIKAVA